MKPKGAVLELNADGTLKADRDERPLTWFVLYREGGDKDGRWRILDATVIAHSEREAFDKAYDAFPQIALSSRVRVIAADQGVVFAPTWGEAS